MLHLPPPCINAYSFCVGDYANIFPSIARNGMRVCTVPMDLFSGKNIISGGITFEPVSINAIKKYKYIN